MPDKRLLSVAALTSNLIAIASIEIGDDNSLEVQKLLTFHDGHSDCDRRYGSGLVGIPTEADSELRKFYGYSLSFFKIYCHC